MRRNYLRSFKFKALSFIACSIFFTTLLCGNVSAANGTLTTIKYYDLQECYTKFSQHIDVESFNSYSDLGGGKKQRTPNGTPDDAGWMKCEQIIAELVGNVNGNDAQSVRATLEKLGYEPAAFTDATVKCVRHKYTIVPGDTGDSYSAYTPKVCAYVDKDNKIVRGDESWASMDAYIWIEEDSPQNNVFNVRIEGGQTISWGMTGEQRFTNDGSTTVTPFQCDYTISGAGDEWNAFLYGYTGGFLWYGDWLLHNGVQQMSSCTNFYAYDGSYYMYDSMETDEHPISAKTASAYDLPSDAFQKKWGNKLRKFNDSEIVDVYRTYLDNANWVEKYCGTDSGQINKRISEGGRAINYMGTSCVFKDLGKVQWHGFKSDKTWGTDVTFDDILSYFDALDMKEYCKQSKQEEFNASMAEVQKIADHPENYTDKQKQNATEVRAKLDDIKNNNKWTTTSPDGTEMCVEIPFIENSAAKEQFNEATFPTTADPQDQGLSELDICMSSAEGLGWIFCLIEDALARMTGEAYDKVVEPMLAVDSDFFATDGELYKAWDIFRNFANVFFVILLLIVILSQVTGFGIDNYGIKKIMPKLIITAILVNVSFFICSIAVDISNVLGSGLKDMLAGLGSDITLTSSGEGTGFMSGLVSTLVVIGIGGGIAAGTVAAIASPGILLSIVVALLGALLGIFFMLVSLGARMVGVILLTVISPLALVLYALPNTSKTFDKWFNAFKAILIVYPICGALIGGGQFAGRLIVGLVGADARPEGGMLAFFYIMLAMLMSVIPFFAIPSLLRNSLSALGNVGEKIRGFGSRATGAATGAVNRGVRSTGAFQRAEGRAEMRKIDREAARGQRYINRHANDTGLAARMSRRRLGQAYAAVNKSRREGLSMEREGRTYDSWAATQAGIQAGYEEEDIKNQTALIEAGQYAGVDNINDINQLSNALSNAQTETEAAALKGVLEKVHGKNGMDAVAAAYTNTGNGMSDGARQRIARDIAKDSSYKTSARSVYDSATRTASSGAFSAPNLNTSAGNLKATDVPNLTSAEFSRIVGSFDNHGNYTGSQITSVEGARAAQAAVYEALQGDGMKDMKAEEIRAAKEFVRGYVPPDAVVDSRTETTASGGTINIRTTQDGRQIDDSGNIVNLR